ncbi:MAG TPA: ferritin [Anaerolineaceae bacterium]
MNKNLVAEINKQIQYELASGYLYLSMAAHFESANLGGFAHWMKIQAKEEQEHALKFFEYLIDRGEKVVLQAIEQPPAEFGTPLSVFEQALEHEKGVTARIYKLYKLAQDDGDYASQSFLTWYVNEQVEEEKNASQIVEWLKMAGSSTNALFMLDSVLRKRGE